jgi:FtsP/CotA-like multicopper oxidase with cupredoxin domain
MLAAEEAHPPPVWIMVLLDYLAQLKHFSGSDAQRLSGLNAAVLFNGGKDMISTRWFWLSLLALPMAAGPAPAQMHGHGHGTPATPAAATFDRSTAGLTEALPSREQRLEDGALFDLTAAPVSKQLAGRTLRMYAYNGSIPGPLLRVRQGSTLTVRFANRLDLDSSVHWHGVRVENAADGVPGVTQEAVRPGASHIYRLRFPDAGLYWYHPHHREDVTQELGLYGGILVEPASKQGSPGGWPVVDREVVLFLDDILLQGGDVEPFYRDTVTHTLSGRFGTTLLANGGTDWNLEVGRGERVRFFLANAANTRTFAVCLEEQALKLIGSDGRRAAREVLTSSVVLGPSERAVVDVLFQSSGYFRLQHKSPLATVSLGTVRVRDASATAVPGDFFRPGGDEGVAREAADLLARAPSQPDYVLSLRVQGAMMGMMGGMTGMTERAAPIEWEEDGHMAMMNRMSTDKTLRWIIRDLASGREGMEIPLEAEVGQVRLLRLVNEGNAEHPMQHPIHLHGQRFLVVARDGQADTNPMWKDTVLLPAGSAYDLLVEFSSPGRWLLHCHIPEHMEAGMMAVFDVKERA